MSRHRGLPVAAIAVGAIAVALLTALLEPRRALACSGDGDPVELADVIVAGRVVDLSIVEGIMGRGTPRTLVVAVTFEVD